MNEQTNKNISSSKGNGSIAKKALLYGGVAVAVPLLLIYLFLAFYYKNHFYHNTTINGVSVSSMTEKQAEAAINEEVESYVLAIKERNDVTEKIYGEDIGLNTVYDEKLSDLLTTQNPFTWPFSLLKPHDITMKAALLYNDELFKEYFDGLKCFAADYNIAPTDAHISDYGDSGYVIVPENQGSKVDSDKMLKAVKKSILSLEPELNLEKAEVYEKPAVYSDNAELLKAMDKMNKMAGSRITYHFGDATEVLDGEKISKWLSVDDKMKVTLDENGVKEYVDYIGKTYNSFGRTRTFKTSYGDVIQVKGGDYGWWLDRATEKDDLIKLIKKGQQIERKPVYFQTAQQYGTDDIGNTYVEVNLTAQHLFFYKDGKLVLESDFVSGNLSRNFGTPVGTYPVQYKENDATLNGEDYSTPVKYWMPFNHNIGFHDAPWRGSSFGGRIYMTSGSHGCINMPPSKAKLMFANIKRGVAVVVYELAGTESNGKDNKDSLVNKKPEKSNKTNDSNNGQGE
ncbi:Putative peptidoglycan binding domain-containing protein [Anaerocolumna jejuensis DSM 15929]|uniref:Putative peptidoglycan binding domain-containing protein n=1 Tax=Anaerocolumna jejuensis DSM 15929 TaxID=1121322 RepID=A0A1M6TJV6_9FIRM|nr:L,D-transpeptidase family protein [Anaerocolumna jejuensis]SHK57255.1 Putative peptidoglycan binding domain-containing protein [Anaerocolumna jejuensis DSM 15929]